MSTRPAGGISLAYTEARIAVAVEDIAFIQYLLVRPLAPDAGSALADQAAGYMRALDDLGPIVRAGR